jgi:hypothetical protein
MTTERRKRKIVIVSIAGVPNKLSLNFLEAGSE